MLTFTYVEINVFALVILALIFFNIYHWEGKQLLEQKLYIVLLCSNAIILALDTAMLDDTPTLPKSGFIINNIRIK